MKKVIIGISFIVLWIGCSNQQSIELPAHVEDLENLRVYSPDVEPAYQIHLEREQTFGETEEVLIGTPGQLVVDNSGRVYISDTQKLTVHIFQPDSNYLVSFGGEGEGPGEFHWVGNMDIQSNQLFVFDPNQRGVNVFTFTPEPHSIPEYSHTINLSGENWKRVAEEGFMSPGLHSIRNDGSLLLVSRNSPLLYREDPEFQGHIQYYLLDKEGTNVSDKIFELRMPEHIVTEWFTLPPPFYGRGLMALSADDHIFSAWTDDFLIKVHDSDGNYQRAFYHPVTKSALSRDEAINSMDDHEQLQNAVRSIQLPETWPALNQMFIDDKNRIWVATIVDDLEVYDWWILDEYGELLARFTWPRNQAIRLVKNDYLYTPETEEETGLQQIVKYRITLEM